MPQQGGAFDLLFANVSIPHKVDDIDLARTPRERCVVTESRS